MALDSTTPATTTTTTTAQTRPLGSLEGFFKVITEAGKAQNREHWVIWLVLKLKLPSSSPQADPEPHLRRAWQVLRHQFPGLGASIVPAAAGGADSEGDDPAAPAYHLSVEPEFDPEAWDRDTFTRHDEGAAATAQDLLGELPPPGPGAARCGWVPASGEVVLRSSHWRTDGVGMAMLGGALARALADVLARGPDLPLASYARLPHGGAGAGADLLPPNVPGVLEALEKRRGAGGAGDATDTATTTTTTATKTTTEPGPPPPPRPSTPPAAAAGCDHILGTYLRGFPGVYLPARPGSEGQPPGATGRVSLSLDRGKTAEVAAASRSRLGVSVTSAAHAALARAAAALCPPHPAVAAGAYCAFAPADLRAPLRTFRGGGVGEVGPLGLFHLGLPICVQGVAGKSFAEVAREMGDAYSVDANAYFDPSSASGEEGEGKEKLSLHELIEPVARRTQALMTAPPPPGLPPAQSPDLSSLGRLERYVGTEYYGQGQGASGGGGGSMVEVEDVWLTTEVCTRALQFHVWSFRGRLGLSAAYNVSYYEPEFVRDVAQRVLDELLAGLEIHV